MAEDFDVKAPIDKKRVTIFFESAGLAVLVILLGVGTYFFFKVKKVADLNQAQIDAKVAEEAARIQAEFDAKLALRLEEELTKPYTEYAARDFYGAFTFQHPRFYYLTIHDFPKNREQLQIYIDPSIVVEAQDQKTYAFMRVFIKDAKYDDELRDLENKNKFRVANKLAFTDTEISGIKGKQVIGKVDDKDPDTKFVFVPYRDKTMYIYCDDYKKTLPDGRTREALYDILLGTFNLRK